MSEDVLSVSDCSASLLLAFEQDVSIETIRIKITIDLIFFIKFILFALLFNFCKALKIYPRLIALPYVNKIFQQKCFYRAIISYMHKMVKYKVRIAGKIINIFELI